MRSLGSSPLIAAALALRAPLRAPLPPPPRAAVGAREGWRESDTSTVFGRARSPATDARDGGDDYVTLDMDVIVRARAALSARSAAAERADATMSQDQLLEHAFAEQSARRGLAAESALVRVLGENRTCGAAWYGLGALLHEYQHGGLDEPAGSLAPHGRLARLAEARDAALIAARYEEDQPRESHP